MDKAPDKTIFSLLFDVMMYLGFWVIDSNHRTKKLLYSLYTYAAIVWILFMSYTGILDFLHSIPQINKMIYNVCFNIFIVGTLLKIILTLSNHRRINSLRRKLHRSLATCRDAQELHFYHTAVSDVTNILKLFGLCFVLLYPTWIFMSMFSDILGERQFPIPSKWPTDIDINNPFVFIPITVFHGLFAFFFLAEAATLDASTFGHLAQLNREYRFLIKRINEFGEFCEDMFGEESAVQKGAREKNACLRKIRVKRTLGEIIGRQKDLFEFSEDFEHGYNKSMFLHLFAGGTLLCVNGIQAMIFSFDFSVKIAYQFGYALIILVDILYLCWLSNRISVKCFEVGNAFYGTPWYKLDVDVQKDISFVILRSQKPPRITSGRYIELNLRTSMLLLKNIYSWLAMFRQVALK